MKIKKDNTKRRSKQRKDEKETIMKGKKQTAVENKKEKICKDEITTRKEKIR